MARFVDCLVWLPDLKTLEILENSSRALISEAHKRKHFISPGVCKLHYTRVPQFHWEISTLTFVSGLHTHAPAAARSHSKDLKCGNGCLLLVGLYCGFVDKLSCLSNHAVGWSRPNLWEFGVIGSTRVSIPPSGFLGYTFLPLHGVWGRNGISRRERVHSPPPRTSLDGPQGL